MRDGTVARVGGFAAIVLGVLTTLASLVYLLLPADLRLGVAGAKLLPAYQHDPGLLPLELTLLALVGVVGLGVVPAISARAGHSGEAEGWLRWAATLATVGYAVSAVSNFLTLGRLPKVAQAYVAGDASTKAAILPFWRSTLDWQGFWQLAAVGIWILVVSVLLLRAKAVAAPLVYVGLALGVLSVVAPIGVISGSAGFLNVVVALGAILSPIWYVWIGLVLLEHSQSAPISTRPARPRTRS